MGSNPSTARSSVTKPSFSRESFRLLYRIDRRGGLKRRCRPLPSRARCIRAPVSRLARPSAPAALPDRGANAALERMLAAGWPAPARASVASDASGRTGFLAKPLAPFASHSLPRRWLHSPTTGPFPSRRRETCGCSRRPSDSLSAISGRRTGRWPTRSTERRSCALDEEDLTPDERARLDALVAHLRLSPDRRGMLHRAQAQALLQRMLGPQSPQQRLLTQQEAGTMRAMAEKFGTRIDFGVATQAHFDRFALLWQIEHGELPAIAVRIKLLKGRSVISTRRRAGSSCRRVTRQEAPDQAHHRFAS